MAAAVISTSALEITKEHCAPLSGTERPTWTGEGEGREGGSGFEGGVNGKREAEARQDGKERGKALPSLSGQRKLNVKAKEESWIQNPGSTC